MSCQLIDENDKRKTLVSLEKRFYGCIRIRKEYLVKFTWEEEAAPPLSKRDNLFVPTFSTFLTPHHFILLSHALIRGP